MSAARNVIDTDSREYRHGWADGEQWVMEHIWEYVLLRSRVGWWVWRAWSRVRRAIRRENEGGATWVSQ